MTLYNHTCWFVGGRAPCSLIFLILFHCETLWWVSWSPSQNQCIRDEDLFSEIAGGCCSPLPSELTLWGLQLQGDSPCTLLGGGPSSPPALLGAALRGQIGFWGIPTDVSGACIAAPSLLLPSPASTTPSSPGLAPGGCPALSSPSQNQLPREPNLRHAWLFPSKVNFSNFEVNFKCIETV